MKDEKFITMAFESSCDETSVAVLADGRQVLANVISSQIDIFRQYGGVVPEIASRHHLENINQVVDQAMAESGVTWDDIDLIGVTKGPGLVGALVIGVATAKAMAFAHDIPLVGVHHILGHISANYIEYPALEPPFMALVTSGGHTWKITTAAACWEPPGTTQWVKHTIKWPGCWVWGIRAVRRWIGWRRKGIRRPFSSRGSTWKRTAMISASAA